MYTTPVTPTLSLTLSAQVDVYHACQRVVLAGSARAAPPVADTLLRCFDAPGYISALLAAGAAEGGGARGGVRPRPPPLMS